MLGHPLEGLGPGVIAAKCPNGNRDFYLKEVWELAGMYSGDTQLMLGIAQSLVNTGTVNAEDIAKCQIASYKLLRGYREWDQRVMDALTDGDDCRETGRKFLLGGWSLSGAAKIAPLGLAYREANNVVLLKAVQEAIVSTHTHQAGIEAAFVQAMAVKALVRGGPESMSPTAFLKHLMERCREEDMKKRLKLMLMWVPYLTVSRAPKIPDWSEFLRSEEFGTIMKVRRMIAEEKQMKGSQAVACALWALCCCWEAPEDAVVCSTHLGGYTHSIAAMTGALAGARHGRSWLPDRWLDNLENGSGGRDDIIALGQKLALLDIRS